MLNSALNSLVKPLCRIIFNCTYTQSRPSSFRPRRAVMYVPGSEEKKILKIPSLKADCLVLDLEDGVATSKKEEARNLVLRMLPQLQWPGQADYAVRLNSVQSGLAEEDIRAVAAAQRLPTTLMVPKIDSVDHINWVYDKIWHYFGGRLDGNMDLIIFTESAQSLLGLSSICHRGKQLSENSFLRLDGVVFGSDDFCANVGITRTSTASELLYARQKIVVTAKANGLQAIDLVYINYKDLDGLKIQSEEGARMGFSGKQVIHPSQVSVVQEAFSPSQSQLDWARQLIAAFELHQQSGKGAFTFQGSMIDMPSLLQAKNIIHLDRINKNIS